MALPHLQDIFGPTRCITQGWKHWNSSESGQHTTGAITKIHLKTLLCVFLVYDHPYLNPRALVESFHRPIKYGGCFVFFCWFFLLLVFFLFCFEVDSKTHHKYKLCFVFFGVVVVVFYFATPLFLREVGHKFTETLPETNIAPQNGWLEYDGFLLGYPIFRCYNSFREGTLDWNIALDWNDWLCLE